MEKKELVDLVSESSGGDIDSFLDKKKSTASINTELESVKLDIGWLEKIEETIPHLDNIIRKPKKFIIQEEEIVNIDKAKKITLESIRHLGQHTNLIQDYDAKTDTVTPSKILNINKEESYDIYENRFIKTLLDNLIMFIHKKKGGTEKGSFSNYERHLDYVAETIVNAEKIKVSMKMETKKFEDFTGSGGDLTSRIEKIELILGDFYKSQFIKSLLNITPVRSPIRKTNVILKNTDFQKALDLWEFIETYDLVDQDAVNEKKAIEVDEEMQNDFDMTFFMNYMILRKIQSDANTSEEEKKNQLNTYYLKKLVEDFVDKNQDMTEKEFRKLLDEQFELAYGQKRIRYKQIEKIFERAIERFYTGQAKLNKMLK